ncbi:MAG: hypothetical protein ABIE07_07140 [Candidatus Zixiibacteriota bacterium]
MVEILFILTAGIVLTIGNLFVKARYARFLNQEILPEFDSEEFSQLSVLVKNYFNFSIVLPISLIVTALLLAATRSSAGYFPVVIGIIFMFVGMHNQSQADKLLKTKGLDWKVLHKRLRKQKR